MNSGDGPGRRCQGYTTLVRYLRPLRRIGAAGLAALPPQSAPPAVRQVTGWITGLPGHLDPEDAERLHAIRARCPESDAAVRHVAGFARMIKALSGDKDTLTGGWAPLTPTCPRCARSPPGCAATWTPWSPADPRGLATYVTANNGS